MDLHELKTKVTKESIGINETFENIFTFVDFANVNYWYEDDRYDANAIVLPEDKKLSISIEKLKDFADIFSLDTRFYYGHDPANIKSLRFLTATKNIFGRNRVFTKPVQKVKHYLDIKETLFNTRTLCHDKEGNFIRIPKCNFDVEICVDAIKLIDKYSTFCLFSSDADFVYLARFLKGKGKRIILIKGGYILHSLHDAADLIVNAQDIKMCIAEIKQKPSV